MLTVHSLNPVSKQQNSMKCFINNGTNTICFLLHTNALKIQSFLKKTKQLRKLKVYIYSYINTSYKCTKNPTGN